jgi:hypothetical protein
MNEVLGAADPILSLLFAGLWCLADREGILEDRPLRIKAELFPYREIPDINRYLTDLERLGFIIRYHTNNAMDGGKYIAIPTFLKHQRPHHTERPSILPKPQITDSAHSCELPVSYPLSNEVNPPDSLIPDSLIPDSLIPEVPPLAPKGARRKKVELDCSKESEEKLREVWSAWPKENPSGEPAKAGAFAPAARAFQRIVDSGEASIRELKACGMLYAKAESYPELKQKIYEAWDHRDHAIMHVATFYGPEKRPYRQLLALARESIAHADLKKNGAA